MQSPKQNPKADSAADKADAVSAHRAPCPHCGYRKCPNCGRPIYPEIRWWPDWRPWWVNPTITTTGTINVTTGDTLPDGTHISIMY